MKDYGDVLPEYKTSQNAFLFPKRGEDFTNVKSKTVPDQALPISEIMKRYTRGIPVDNMHTPVYDEDGSMPDPKSMDISEWYELQDRTKEEVREYKKSLDDINKKAKDKKLSPAERPAEPKVSDSAPEEPKAIP